MNKDKHYKNLLDNGVTTYHNDGSKSVTYKNLLDGGTITYHPDGSKSRTYKNLMDPGYTTYHEDGSKSRTYKNIMSPGTTTYHDDGSQSRTYKNFFDNGATTYHEDNPYRGAGSKPYSNTRASGTPYRVPGGVRRVPRPEENKLDRMEFLIGVLGYVLYFLMTAYVVATFFFHSLPADYNQMFGLLGGALFLLGFVSTEVSSPFGFGGHLLLILIQSLIFFFQVTMRIPWNTNPFAERGELFAMLIGPAVFLAAILLGDLAGYLYSKRLRNKILYKK